jgi:hypothetical protein
MALTKKKKKKKKKKKTKKKKKRLILQGRQLFELILQHILLRLLST